MKTISFKIMAVAAILSLTVSCSLDFDPTTAYSEKTFWYSAKNAQSGLTGCYLPMRNGSMFGGGTMAWEECITPNAYNYDNRQGWNDIAKGSQTAATAIFDGRWNDAWIGIGRCNFLLANIDNNREMTSEAIGQMKAQARFLRALYYSVLTTYYYTAPFITDQPNITHVGRSRVARETLLDFILSELDAVTDILPDSYTATADLGRATSGAALALKARVLNFEASPLLNEDNDTAKWQLAANAAKAVIDLDRYDLHPDYKNLFTVAEEHSSECIFDVEAIQNPTGMGHSTDVIHRQWQGAAPLKEMIDAYRTKDGVERTAPASYDDVADYADLDPRFYSTIVYPGSTFMGETVKTDGNNTAFRISITGYTFRKYTIYTESKASATDAVVGENSSPINRMLLRYADILLMYAEAMNEQNLMTEAIWNSTVKAIRQRAGFTAAAALDYPAGGQDAIRDEIRYERRIEFAGEGMWYNDLRRWKEAENIMNNITIRMFDGKDIMGRNFNSKRDYWWPISSTQLTEAPTLAPNNPGW